MENGYVEVDFFEPRDLTQDDLKTYTLKDEVVAYFQDNVTPEKADIYYDCFRNLMRANLSSFFKTQTDIALVESEVINIIYNSNMDGMTALANIDRILKDAISLQLKLVLITLDEEASIKDANLVIKYLLNMLDLDKGLKLSIVDSIRGCISSSDRPDYTSGLATALTYYEPENMQNVYDALGKIEENVLNNIMVLFEDETEEFEYDDRSLDFARDISIYFNLIPQFFDSQFIKDMLKLNLIGKTLEFYINQLALYYKDAMEASYDDLKLYDVVRAAILSDKRATYTKESLKQELLQLELKETLNVYPEDFSTYVVTMFDDMKKK